MKKLGKGSTQIPISFGAVYQVKNVEPLDGGEVKDRFVIVVDTNSAIAAGADPLIAVVCSTKPHREDTDKVSVPNKRDTPQTRSGIPLPCWAIPRWHVPFARSRLVEWRGKLNNPSLAKVVEAYLRRIGRLD